ncbi:MAG: hypothetical protein ACP5TV_07160 [Anaerolineae bacterium]
MAADTGVGEQFEAVQEAEQRWEPAAPGEGEKRMGVAMDGGMVHIRGEGWKEVKVGCVFAVGQRVEFDALLREPWRWDMPVGPAVWRIWGARGIWEEEEAVGGGPTAGMGAGQGDGGAG